jgi:hypothetical protein
VALIICEGGKKGGKKEGKEGKKEGKEGKKEGKEGKKEGKEGKKEKGGKINTININIQIKGK